VLKTVGERKLQVCCRRSAKEAAKSARTQAKEEKIAILKHVIAPSFAELFPDGRI
jgi:hypothetical protein